MSTVPKEALRAALDLERAVVFALDEYEVVRRLRPVTGLLGQRKIS